MKKIVTFLLLVMLVPTMVTAQEVTSETLEETLKKEKIEYNLENYKEEEGKVPVYLFRGQGLPRVFRVCCIRPNKRIRHIF